MNFQTRFKFIAHALDGDGGFRPTVSYVNDAPTVPAETYLIRYPRESASKFARRNEVAFYESDLARHTSRFVSYIASKAVTRDLKSELFRLMQDDIDGKGNSVDVFWQDFGVEARARGTMLLLVDMPASVPPSAQGQLAQRAAPYWTPIKPERVTDYLLGPDGKFDIVEFSGMWSENGGKPEPVVWTFDRYEWQISRKTESGVLERIDGDTHGLDECPVLIFTERGDFPCFGAFAEIADLSRRLFNLNSELDEILRGQTFSLLTQQVKDTVSEVEKLEIAQTSGETIGTQNMLMHTGSTPAFIAPPDGPAATYLTRIEKVESRIDRIGLQPTGSSGQESGFALQMRFTAINAELSRFAERLEDLERRAWELSKRWLGITEEADIAWPRDFNIADTEQELTVLQEMQAAQMPDSALREQKKRIVTTQFNGADDDTLQAMMNEIDQEASAV